MEEHSLLRNQKLVEHLENLEEFINKSSFKTEKLRLLREQALREVLRSQTNYLRHNQQADQLSSSRLSQDARSADEFNGNLKHHFTLNEKESYMPHLANRHFKWPMDSSYPFERSRRVKFSEAIDKLISDCETSRRHKMSKSMWKTSPLPNSSINSHSIQNTPTTQKPLISDKSHPRLRTISPLNTEAYDLFSRPTSNRYDKQTESVRTTSEMMHTKHHQNQSNVLGATLNGEVEFSNCDTQPSTPNDEVDRHKTDSLVEDRRQTISIFNENETFLERPVVLEVQKPEHFRTIKTVRRSNKIEENEISDESNLRNLTDQSKSEEKAKSVAVEVSQLESSVKSTSNNKQAEKQNSIHMADSTPDQPVHIQSDLIKESVVHRTLREQVALSSDVCELNSSNKLPPSFHDTSHMLNNPAFSLRTTYENDAGVNETISSNTDICHTLSVKSVEDVHNHDINDEEHENASFHGDSTNQNESQTFSLSKEVLDPADTTEKIPEDSHVPKDTTQDESMKKEEQPKKGILQFLSSDERDDDDDDDDSFFDIPQPTNTTGFQETILESRKLPNEGSREISDTSDEDCDIEDQLANIISHSPTAVKQVELQHQTTNEKEVIILTAKGSAQDSDRTESHIQNSSENQSNQPKNNLTQKLTQKLAVHLGLDTPLSAISDTTHVNRDEETKDDDDFDFYD